MKTVPRLLLLGSRQRSSSDAACYSPLQTHQRAGALLTAAKMLGLSTVLVFSNATSTPVEAVEFPPVQQHHHVSATGRELSRQHAAERQRRSSATPAQLPRWIWPVPRVLPLLSSFEAPSHRYGAGHRGIDIAAAPGNAVMAVDDGVVTFVGFVVDREVTVVTHAAGWRSSYEPARATVPVGTAVAKGAPIAEISEGNGHCPVSCLHLGARNQDDYFSPLLLLEDLEPSILVAWSGRRPPMD